MSSPLRPPSATTSLRVQRLVERAMTYAVEYDDDLTVARLAWLAHDDQLALDQACAACLSYTDIDLGIRGRAIGLLYPDLPPEPRPATANICRQLSNAMLGLAVEGG